MNIGVLALQGGISEHLAKISELGYNGIEVKRSIDLDKVERLIIPGGESTTLCEILKEDNLIDEIKVRINSGMKVWGTCAGLILLASDIRGENLNNIGLMDITVERNAFGRQVNSFHRVESLDELGINDFNMIFIRAPIIEMVGSSVKIIKVIDQKIVAASESNMLVTSFHPELTNDNRFHKYFIERF